MKKKLAGILSACLALALGVGALTACSAPDTPSEPAEGEIYRTEAVTSGSVGAYFSFKTYPEGEENEWGHTGNIYEMNVSAWGREYSMWNDGYWALEGNTLSLTPISQDEPTKSNPTLIVDAMVNEAKVFTLTDGKFMIPIKACGEDMTIIFDPETDLVDEIETPSCTEHIDENADGKCDVCGEDMPEEDVAKVQVTLTARASAEIANVMTVNADAKLDLYTDSTWKMSVKTDADPSATDYLEAASGTYTVDMTTYAMTLTVTKETVENSLPATFTVACDASGYPDLVYSANVSYVSYGMTFAFAFTNAVEEEKQPMVTLTGTAQSPFEGYTVNAEAKLELYEDQTWTLLIKSDANPAGAEFEEAASGTWALDSATYVTTLTVTEQLVKNSLPETITVSADYSSMPNIVYSASVTYTNVGAFAFALTGTMAMGA